ncbi:MAG: methyltransferase domain-containing protein, partial [Dokdonella sp.]
MRGAFDLRQVRRSFGRAAASYEAHAVLQGEVETRLQERLDDETITPNLIVDAGSGSGRGAASLRKRYPNSTLLALDLALPMLRQARRHQTWLRPFGRVCADVQALPLADASIDLLYSNLCLQWCA